MEICFETIKLDMEKLKKAFVYGLIVTVVVNGIGFLVAVDNAGLESTINDFKRECKLINYFLPKSAGISPQALVSHFTIVVS